MAGALVGEAFLSASMRVLCDNIGSGEFMELFRGKKLDESLMRKLKIALWSLSAVLNDAEEKQITNRYVTAWLGELQDAVFDAEDVVDEINTEVLRCKVEAGEYQTVKVQVWNFLSSLNPFYQCMNGRIQVIFERLEHLAKQKDVLGLKEDVVRGKGLRRTPTTSLVDESWVFGRDEDKEKLVKLLLSDDDASNKDVSVITIVGVGGVGKTTLAQLLYNDVDVKRHFNLRTWAYVYEDFDVVRVTKTILQSVTSKTYDSNDLIFLQVELEKHLRGKKFLFVLDDLWNENCKSWSMLRHPFTFGAKGSRVVVTTRNESVASGMHTVPIHYLERLSDEDCWLLLSKHAFENGSPSAHPDLEEIGKKIARKCNGLPLAAKTVGGLLRFKANDEQWNGILNNKFWELPHDKCKTLPALRLSYYYLPSHLKRCFAYCALFPKGYEFEREDLLLLWSAESLVPHAKSEEDFEEVSKKYFDELFSRSLFQRSNMKDSGFIMHDLINDLAMSVYGKYCVRLEGRESHEVLKRVRHLSCARGNLDCAAKFEPLYGFKRLRTFLPLTQKSSWDGYVSTKVSHDLLPSLICLRVLSLYGYYNIVELPDSIGNLIHLRYLNLSRTAIKRLPAIVCTLYNLQTLLLSDCYSLTELPADMRKLINLRRLDFGGTKIEEMPVQMGRLKSLRTLSGFVVGKSVGSGIGELRELPHLRGKLSLLNLQNVLDPSDASEANLKNKKDLKELELVWGHEGAYHSEKVRDVLDKLQPGINLEKLTIQFYSGKGFPNWLGDSAFNKIQVMRLKDCHSCLVLPSLGQLPALKELFICKMKSLTTVGPEFYGNVSSLPQPFQSLEMLQFEEMPKWEEWIPSPSGGQCPDFPRLQELILYRCPKLRGSLPYHLPCLRKLRVSGCGVLCLHDEREMATTTTTNDATLKELVIVDGGACLLPLLETNFMSILCLSIRKLFALQCLPKMKFLQHLFLEYCPNLLSFPRDGLPSTLTRLEIFHCPRLEFPSHEMIAKLTSLESLLITNSCDSMRSFPLGIFHKISKLTIWSCDKLESLSIEGADDNLRHLHCLQIWDCPKLVSFPQGGMPAPNLIYLTVIRCYNLKSFLQGMHTLTALRELTINSLPNLVSFAEGGLPPNLRSFRIENCERLRPSVEWGLQGLVSLKELTIGGRGSDEIFDVFLKEQLLPTTLHTLQISNLSSLKSVDEKGLGQLTSLQDLQVLRCPKLEVLPEEGLKHLTSLRKLSISGCDSLKFLPGEGLKHLTSLQYLHIDGCDNLQFIPEKGLPASLFYLSIYRSIALEKRCKSKTGEDWAKISHIPCMHIGDEVTI